MKTKILLPMFLMAFWACTDNESNPVKTDVPEPPTSSETVPSSSSVVAAEPDTCGSFIDARDGQSYCTVKIGEQTWMAKNLAYAISGSICRSDNPANCEKYGRLYSWAQAIGKTDAECGVGKNCALTEGQFQGACPEGWALPDTSDWKQLMRFVRENNEGESLAASLLSTEEPEWAKYVTATDRFGFAALASAGSYSPTNAFTGDDRTYFWSRTQDTFGDDDYKYAHMFLVQPLDEVVRVGSAGKGAQYSVRCIKY